MRAAIRNIQRILPRTEIPPIEFSRKCVLPDGRGKGTFYDPDSHQVQKAILDEVASGITKLTIVKPVQDGGSLVAQILLFYSAVIKKRIVIIAYPSQESAEDIWQTKVAPMMHALGGVAPTKGQGSEGGVGRVMMLPGGGAFLLRTAGGKGESQSASVTAETALLDELDDWQSLDRARAMIRRIEEAEDPLVIEVSTVKRAENSIILAEYEMGSKGRMWYQCPSCKLWQKLEWEQVRWDEKDGHLIEDTERIVCTRTGCVLPNDQRGAMLATGILLHAGQSLADDGRITGERTVKHHTSILWSRLESPRRTLSSMIDAFLEAKAVLDVTGDHGPMKRFYHDYLCRPYDGDRQELNSNGPITPALLQSISAKSDLAPVEYKSDFIEGSQVCGTFARRWIQTIPEDVEHTFAGIDVQNNRVYWVLIGANKRAQEFELGWGQEWARSDARPASPDEMFLLFDRTAALMRNLSRDVPFHLGAIDAGDFTDLVRRWSEANRPQWIATRGGGANLVRSVEPGDIEGISYYRDGLLFLNVDNIRDGYHAAIRRDAKDPGAIRWPSGIELRGNRYFSMLCKRQSIIVDNKTRKKDVLINPGREDWLDARVYARAMILGWLAAVGQEHRERMVQEATVQQAAQSRSIRSALETEENSSIPAPLPRMINPNRGNISGRNLLGRNRQWRR